MAFAETKQAAEAFYNAVDGLSSPSSLRFSRGILGAEDAASLSGTYHLVRIRLASTLRLSLLGEPLRRFRASS